MKNRRAVLLALSILVVTGAAACGGTDAGDPLAIYPPSTEVDPSQTARFDATGATAGSNLTGWTVVESGGGWIDSTGRYVAPGIEGTYHVAATSSTSSAQQVATVRVVKKGIRVNVSPAAATVAVGATLTLTGKVTGTSGDAVTWSVVEPGGGTVVGGVYVAPATPGTYHVSATSVVDTARSDFATVTVLPAPPPPPPVEVRVTVTPTSVSVETGATAQFGVDVAGSGDASVTWSVLEGAAGGVVSATGQYSAPSAPGTYHVVATSNADPAKTATATVLVSAPAEPPPTTNPPTDTTPPPAIDTGWSVTRSPPAMTNPTTITLPGSYLSTVYSSFCSGPGYVVNLDDGQDYIIRADAPLQFPVRISGGNNVRIVGLQIDLSSAASYCNDSGETPNYVPGSHGLRVDNVGTTFFEGLYMDAGNHILDMIVVRNKIGGYDALSKGYTEAQARGAHDIVLQNSVVRGYQSDADPNGEHADLIQTQGLYEIYRDITLENVSVDSLSEGAIFLARAGYHLANTITMRNFDYRLDARWTPVTTGGPVMHNAKAYSYENVFLSVDVVRQYDLNTGCGGGCVQPGNGSVGVFSPATPSALGFADRFASPGAGGASNAWVGLNYVSPHD
ncbi:Ig-like domain-containing protein [Anaeromyxobacter sp. Fw109-5]|uniref:Ig-like domain-containing protein n=1 Tax=Anaeromyxobacter sp. (strain Fw109-5) TaxID=404589 RepID=UPI0000ED80C7|nr:Ig-like domain-containing protein [Anaeromyxobacter sp. Fw109-5]ABS25441.1 Ig domain protein group 2 domain protein [Anaeromyxobacter sp. Fw109-5]